MIVAIISVGLAGFWAKITTLLLGGGPLLFGGAFLFFLVIVLLMFARARAWSGS